LPSGPPPFFFRTCPEYRYGGGFVSFVLLPSVFQGRRLLGPLFRFFAIAVRAEAGSFELHFSWYARFLALRTSDGSQFSLWSFCRLLFDFGFWPVLTTLLFRLHVCCLLATEFTVLMATHQACFFLLLCDSPPRCSAPSATSVLLSRSAYNLSRRLFFPPVFDLFPPLALVPTAPLTLPTCPFLVHIPPDVFRRACFSFPPHALFFLSMPRFTKFSVRSFAPIASVSVVSLQSSPGAFSFFFPRLECSPL